MPRLSGGDIEKARTLAHERVDREAGEARLRYVTLDPGMELVYPTKLAEAERLLADPDPETNIPWWETVHLHSEALAFNITRTQRAIEIVQAAAEWGMLSAHIEGLRTKAKSEISSATTIGQIHSAANVTWGV